MNRYVLAGTTLFLSFLLGQASAQESVLAEVYGQGVHAYFARNYQTAHQLLSSAIKQGSRDPRCYFFRGLTYASLGRPDEAETDFKTAAELEVMSTDRVYPVSDSLQRVQGKSRIQIERHRQSARLAMHQKASQVQQARYEELKRNEQEVLRNPGRAPAAAPADINALPSPMPSGADPFAANAEAQPEKAPDKPAEPAVEPAAVPAGDDPFGAAPKANPAPASDDTKVDPFTDDKPASGTPPTPPPAAKPAEDDPFK